MSKKQLPKKRTNFKTPRVKETWTERVARQKAAQEAERMSDCDRHFNGFLPASHWKEDE
jgi:hypothetical protein